MLNMQELQASLKEIEKRHKEILWTTVRVRAKDAWGSGTVIGCTQDAKGKYHTYVVTCHHVVASNIKVEKKWDQQYGMDIKKEIKTPAEVQMFYYEHLSHAKGLAGSYRANILGYDEDQDIALLELEKESPTEPVAYLFPHDKVDEEIHVFDDVWAVGAAMAHEPIATKGIISFMDEIIDDYGYYMSTAQIIFGNSGGAIFRYSNERKCYEFLGIPARVTVNLVGFSPDPITHMGFFVPIVRIYKFLAKNHYDFIYDKAKTYEECEEERKADKERHEKLLMAKYGGVEEKETRGKKQESSSD